MEALRIAVCEDSAIEQKRLIFLINGCGIPAVVSAFDSGEALLADFGRGKYDLIFMDIYMEGMTGIDAVTAIRKIDSHVPVAFATTSTEFALESYRLDALKYIEKPVQKKAVMELLELARFKKEQIPSLLLQISGKDVSIPFDQITYAEQMGHAVVFHLHESWMTMKTVLICSPFSAATKASWSISPMHRRSTRNFTFSPCQMGQMSISAVRN